MVNQNSKEEVERLTKVAKDSYIKRNNGDTGSDLSSKDSYIKRDDNDMPSDLPSKDSYIKRDDNVPSASPYSEIVIKIDGIQNDDDDEDQHGTMNNGYSKDL